MFPELAWRWFPKKDGDPHVRYMVNRHYSARRYKDGRRPKLSAGPGYKDIYETADGLATFIWRKFISDDGQVGINCAMFRNEGPELSSSLILEAEQLAWLRWPGERLYTYLDSEKTKKRRGKKNPPGYCYLMAGWKYCGMSKGGLYVLEKLPCFHVPSNIRLHLDERGFARKIEFIYPDGGSAIEDMPTPPARQ